MHDLQLTKGGEWRRGAPSFLVRETLGHCEELDVTVDDRPRWQPLEPGCTGTADDVSSIPVAYQRAVVCGWFEWRRLDFRSHPGSCDPFEFLCRKNLPTGRAKHARHIENTRCSDLTTSHVRSGQGVGSWRSYGQMDHDICLLEPSLRSATISSLRVAILAPSSFMSRSVAFAFGKISFCSSLT
jgi:hypothetical protein